MLSRSSWHRNFLLGEQSSRVSVALLKDLQPRRHHHLQCLPLSPLAEIAVSHQHGFADDAVCRGGIGCFHPAERLLCAQRTHGPFPQFGLVFTLQVWALVSAAPSSSLAQRWLIWGSDLETLKRQIRWQTKPTPSALGRDFFWSLGEMEMRPWEISVVWT